MQKNWMENHLDVGLDFKIEGRKDIKPQMFTTEPDTLFGFSF